MTDNRRLFVVCCCAFYRKGGVTFVLSFPGGPSSVAAYIRARWSIGAVQQRYVFEGEGSDQFCGRTACGLPIHSIEFTTLPPHFKTVEQLTTEFWIPVHPEYADMPQSFKHCMPYLLASLVYHQEWLTANLDPSHAIFSTYLWTSGLIHSLKEDVVTGTYLCQFTGMRATGVPPFVSIMQTMTLLQETVGTETERVANLMEGKYYLMSSVYYYSLYFHHVVENRLACIST